MDSIVYTPKYFGPNAFPVPNPTSGIITSEYEGEIRYDYHFATGDNAQDFYARAYIPFSDKAAFEVSGVIREYYNTSEEVKRERHAANTKLSNEKICRGDVIFTSMFQLLKSKKWLDASLSAGLKTASGNMLIDARYTDAAAYWFNVNFGRNLFSSGDSNKYLRFVGMAGFYCYMTNKPENRQNDAWMGGIGFHSRFDNLHLNADIRGFEGYWNNGDEPLLLHLNFKYRYKKHSFYTAYQYGMHDYIYQTMSGGYILSFNL